MKDINVRLDSLADNLKEILKEQYLEVSDKVEELENRIDDFDVPDKAELETLSSSVEDIDASLDNLGGEVSDLKFQVEELTSKLKKYEGMLDLLASVIKLPPIDKDEEAA